jgi:hypothetical protein
MNKFFILLGLALVLAGIGWPWIKNLPLGRLPGDILIVRDNFRLFLPITSCLVISIVLSLVFWFFKK